MRHDGDEKKDFKDRDIRRKEIVHRIVNAEGQPVVLAAMHIDDKDMVWIAKVLDHYPHIRALNLSANRITYLGVKHIIRNNTLRALDVSFNLIDDWGMRLFCKNRTILKLQYSPYDYGFATRFEIARMLDRNNFAAQNAKNPDKIKNRGSLIDGLKKLFSGKQPNPTLPFLAQEADETKTAEVTQPPEVPSQNQGSEEH